MTISSSHHAHSKHNGHNGQSGHGKHAHVARVAQVAHHTKPIVLSQKKVTEPVTSAEPLPLPATSTGLTAHVLEDVPPVPSSSPFPLVILAARTIHFPARAS